MQESESKDWGLLQKIRAGSIIDSKKTKAKATSKITIDGIFKESY